MEITSDSTTASSPLITGHVANHTAVAAPRSKRGRKKANGVAAVAATEKRRSKRIAQSPKLPPVESPLPVELPKGTSTPLGPSPLKQSTETRLDVENNLLTPAETLSQPQEDLLQIPAQLQEEISIASINSSVLSAVSVKSTTTHLVSGLSVSPSDNTAAESGIEGESKKRSFDQIDGVEEGESQYFSVISIDKENLLQEVQEVNAALDSVEEPAEGENILSGLEPALAPPEAAAAALPEDDSPKEVETAQEPPPKKKRRCVIM